MKQFIKIKRMKSIRITLVLVVIIAALTAFQKESENELEWKVLDEGLHVSEYHSPIKSEIGDNRITILKIDPSEYDFNLFSAKEDSERTKTASKKKLISLALSSFPANCAAGELKINCWYSSTPCQA